MKIAGFGIACLDCIAQIGSLDNNKSAPILRMERRLGGLVGNALTACRRLGADAAILSAFGDDDEGSTIISLLEQERINTDMVQIFPGRESYFSFIRVEEENADRYIYCKRDTVNPDDITVDERIFTDADVFLLDSHFGTKSIEYAKRAGELGIPTVGDFKINPSNTEILKYTEFPIISVDYALSLTHDGEIKTALEIMSGFNPHAVPVITCGEKGCFFMQYGRIEHIPAFEIVPVDTTAAGDVFHGGFARAIAEGMSVRSALVFASAVSALKCTCFGGSAGTPSMSEVKDFLKKHNL